MQGGFACDSLSPERQRHNFLTVNAISIDLLQPDGAIDSREPGKRGEVLRSATVRHIARRFPAGGAFVLALGAAGLALAPSRAVADPPEAAAVTSMSAAADDHLGPPNLTPFLGNTELEDRLDSARRMTVAGERVHEHLLRRFYAAHRYETVWDGHPAVVAALRSAVLSAGDQGLDPVSFHSAILSVRLKELSPVDRDLLVSDAFLSYADALARGAMPVEERDEDEDLTPGPVDIVAALDNAISTPDPAQAIEALAPNSPEYLAMRRAYANYLAVAAQGSRVAGAGLPARERRVGAAEALRRARQIAINLERLRWLPRDMPADRLIVDTTVSQLQLFRDDRAVFTTRVVVGEFDKQTPELRSVIKYILFNPPWNIPPSIVRKEILPKVSANRSYLAQHHMRWRGPMSVQQEAGPYSALGRLKFEMDDRFDVYLHDTPEKWRFQSADRMMSHGCVRVENPRVLASLLLDESPEEIDKAIDVDRTHSHALPKPLPVFIVYRTAIAESDGSIAFRGDPYQRDDEVWAYLSRAEKAPVAERNGLNSTIMGKAGQTRSTVAQKTATIGE
jgi:L,D-transpeptidase YcbB